jgi:hypothetical protein
MAPFFFVWNFKVSKAGATGGDIVSRIKQTVPRFNLYGNCESMTEMLLRQLTRFAARGGH